MNSSAWLSFINMRKKIIIFGSSGKLGKAITSKAHKFGFDVIGIGNKDENCKKYHQVDYLDFLNLKKEYILLLITIPQHLFLRIEVGLKLILQI